MTKRTPPPFYSNTKDNMHCFQASMKMVLKHFDPKKNYSWKRLNEMSGQKKGKWTWPINMIVNLQKMEYKLVVIDTFDYKRFLKEGTSYFYDLWSKEIADAQIQFSDIPHVLRSYKKLPHDFPYEQRAATFADIRKYLKSGYLIETGVNSAALNKRKGYAGHSVVIYHIDARYIYLHDSGLPPRPSRKVPHALFKKAWNTKSILAIQKD